MVKGKLALINGSTIRNDKLIEDPALPTFNRPYLYSSLGKLKKTYLARCGGIKIYVQLGSNVNAINVLTVPVL